MYNSFICLQTKSDISIESYKSDIKTYTDTAYDYDKYR